MMLSRPGHNFIQKQRAANKMKIHLHWEEDERTCHLPDGNDNCPGCCQAKSPILEHGIHWECIWKKEHPGAHCDIWCNEWE